MVSLDNFSIGVPPALTIRQIRPGDAASVYALVQRNRDHLYRFMDWVEEMTLEAEQAYIEHARKLARRGREMHGVITRAGTIIGMCGYDSLTPPHTHRTARLGYWLDAGETRQGIMRSCVTAMIEYAFNHLDMHRIEIRTIPTNAPSQHLAESLGFTLEATLRQQARYPWGMEDHLVFAILKPEWEARSGES